MALLYEIVESSNQKQISITGYEGTIRRLVIPEEINGLTVTEIGTGAFRGRSDLTEVHLPESIRALKGFAFYGCTNLTSIHLYDGVEDYYDGVIRQCSSLSEITVHMHQDNYRIVKELLGDNDRQLEFSLLFPDSSSQNTPDSNWQSLDTGSSQSIDTGSYSLLSEDSMFRDIPVVQKREVRLLFPSYVNGFVEDTMARAIHLKIDGAGYPFRECVTRKGINYREYDRVFFRAEADDDLAAARIAILRLAYPHELTDDAKTRYRDYLYSHADYIIRGLTDENRTEEVSFLTGEKLIPEAAINQAIAYASGKKRVGILSILMEAKSKQTASKGTLFSL